MGYGYYRIAAAGPVVSVGDINANVTEILRLWKLAESADVALVAFPELCLTGYTCGDLFLNDQVIFRSKIGINELLEKSKGFNSIGIVGVPIAFDDRLFNCAIILRRGKILGIVPKSHIPNYKEFYESRWFASGAEQRNNFIDILNHRIPFGVDLIFESDEKDFSFGVEICEDLWVPVPPSSLHSIAGAKLTVNLSASNDIIGKSEYRRSLVTGQSGRCLSGYLLVSAGIGESTTDLVFSGHALIVENGQVLKETRSLNGELLVSEIDVQNISALRRNESSFKSFASFQFRRLAIGSVRQAPEIERPINPYPFIPKNQEKLLRRAEEIVNLQSIALQKRVKYSGCSKLVIGVSGGLDSTLALLVCHRVAEDMRWKSNQVVAVHMWGFGTSDRTHANAQNLCKLLGSDYRSIDIRKLCKLSFDALPHDENQHDIVFENVQARHRTMHLMNLANKESGIVIGTGDLSEMALGWSTYNGDHMSMYAVNSGVPKTLIKHLIEWFANNSRNENTSKVLSAILATPISPELLPLGKDGQIAQHTEEKIGPYELHDFFLYHFIRFGSSSEKIVYLASLAFAKKYQIGEIEKWFQIFIKRFFQSQYKRSCVPDGPKIGTVSLSPRGDWRMPSDASFNEFL